MVTGNFLVRVLSEWGPRTSWRCSWWTPSPCKAARCRCWLEQLQKFLSDQVPQSDLILIRPTTLGLQLFNHSPICNATSGKSSKLLVSSMDLTWTGMAAGLSLMCSQSTPRNQAPLLMSSRLWIRSSRSPQNLWKESFLLGTKCCYSHSPQNCFCCSLWYRHLWREL